MNKIFAVRGISGSGKSSLINELTKNMSENEFCICCPDNYLMVDGKYIWTRERAGTAHMKSYRKFLESLLEKIPNIFLSQCNLKWSDLKSYVKYGNLAGYEIHLIEPKTWWRNDPTVCYIMNTHELSLEKLEEMKSRMQTNEQIAGFARENLGVKIHY